MLLNITYTDVFTCTVHVCASIQDDFTALIVAAKFNRINVIKELLQGGANCDIQDKVIFTIHVYGCGILLFLKVIGLICWQIRNHNTNDSFCECTTDMPTVVL